MRELDRMLLDSEEVIYSKGDYIPTGFIVRFDCGWFVEYVNKFYENDVWYCN